MVVMLVLLILSVRSKAGGVTAGCDGGVRLTLAPLAAVGVQVVGVQPLGFVQTIQHFADIHHLEVN